MDELVEGVLPVGPRLPPHDGSGVIVHTGAVFGDVLPVGLHVALRTKHTQSHQRATRETAAEEEMMYEYLPSAGPPSRSPPH